MRAILRASVLAISLNFVGFAQAQSAPDATLLALSKTDHALAIVDPASFKVIAKVPVGNDPHEVIASTDGTTAYVSNYGFGAFNTLAVVDLVGRKALPSIDLGALRGPHGLTFVGGKTWFTAEAAKAIGRYDPATHQVDWILGTGQNRTHMIYVSPDMKLIVTTNVSSGTVSIMDQEAVRMPGPPPGAGAGGPGMPPGAEPSGAAGLRLIPGRALAVDPARHAMGEAFWVEATAPALAGAFPAYRRFAMALDTGSAIKGEARADLYLGRGADAGLEAGRVRHILRLYKLTPVIQPQS